MFKYLVYFGYTMETTTIKLHQNTKSLLDEVKHKTESYDAVIRRITTLMKKSDIHDQLVEAYKKMAKRDVHILEEWETASKEIDS